MAFIYFATQIDKCREKVWKKGVEFEEGKKDRSSKRSFSPPQVPTLIGYRANCKNPQPHRPAAAEKNGKAVKSSAAQAVEQ